jgi:hypothetical protein
MAHRPAANACPPDARNPINPKVATAPPCGVTLAYLPVMQNFWYTPETMYKKWQLTRAASLIS